MRFQKSLCKFIFSRQHFLMKFPQQIWCLDHDDNCGCSQSCLLLYKNKIKKVFLISLRHKLWPPWRLIAAELFTCFILVTLFLHLGYCFWPYQIHSMCKEQFHSLLPAKCSSEEILGCPYDIAFPHFNLRRYCPW